jgi:hypothetical protein
VTGITTLGRSRQEEDISSIKEAILQYLFSQEEPRTEPEINNEVEGRTTLKRKALRELVNEERVTKEGKGGKGDPFKYSCSLVPEGIWEQPEQESKNTITIGNINTYSCSPNLANY